jgi:hypothetical protein
MDLRPPYEACAVQLVIFLDMNDVECLTVAIAGPSSIRALIDRGLRDRKEAGSDGKNVIIVCDEPEARDLLRHAQTNCSPAVSKILRAFHLANLIP